MKNPRSYEGWYGGWRFLLKMAWHDSWKKKKKRIWKRLWDSKNQVFEKKMSVLSLIKRSLCPCFWKCCFGRLWGCKHDSFHWASWGDQCRSLHPFTVGCTTPWPWAPCVHSNTVSRSVCAASCSGWDSSASQIQASSPWVPWGPRSSYFSENCSRHGLASLVFIFMFLRQGLM